MIDILIGLLAAKKIGEALGPPKPFSTSSTLSWIDRKPEVTGAMVETEIDKMPEYLQVLIDSVTRPGKNPEWFDVAIARRDVPRKFITFIISGVFVDPNRDTSQPPSVESIMAWWEDKDDEMKDLIRSYYYD